jgi:hypothetical protein
VELTGRVPSLDALGEALANGTPVPIDSADAGTYRNAGLTGLEVVTFPAASTPPRAGGVAA